MQLPDPAEVEPRSPLARACRMLGLPRVRNDLEVLKLVEAGLPGDSVAALARHLEAMQVGAGTMADLVVPRRRVARRRKGGQLLTREQSDRLVRAARIIVLAEDVFGDPAKAFAWLRWPKTALGGQSPLAALATETGGRLVETMLLQLHYGITA